MPRTIAFYLPQYHPTPENDIWWGKGFTEWTNVGRAKPLFKGHYQPKVPSDLGYYDLRLPEVRELQAQYAKDAGIEGFCYWHYWFNGKRLLDSVFTEVLESGDPDFPFCLCWANHSWKAKSWDRTSADKVLMEQTYPGEEDYRNHFMAMLPAFKDSRYMTYEGKLIFGIFDPVNIPDMDVMYKVWNDLAYENGLAGFYFFAFCQGSGHIAEVKSEQFDAIVYDAMYDAVYCHLESLGHKIRAKFFNGPIPMDYGYYTGIALKCFDKHKNAIPCIVPNFDHSPRSGANAVIMHDSTPEKWRHLCDETISRLSGDDLLFVKAWNEWGEGNYLEPDLRYGKRHIEELAAALKK